MGMFVGLVCSVVFIFVGLDWLIRSGAWNFDEDNEGGDVEVDLESDQVCFLLIMVMAVPVLVFLLYVYNPHRITS